MIIGNPLLLKKAADDSTPAEDPVTRSLRLAGSHYLTKTFSSSGNRKTYTIAFWVKRSKISTSSTQVLFSAAPSGHNSNPNIDQISFRPNDTLEFYQYPSGSQESRLATAAVFRDTSAWMHCCFSVDTTLPDSEETDRVKIFVNGVLQSVATYTDYPSQNHESLFNKSEMHKIGEEAIRDRYNSDVLISDFYFIDGTALSTPVGNLIEDTGYSSYKPKAFDMSSYSGNSFHIDAQPAHDADLLVTSVGRNDGDTTFADVAAGHTVTRYGNTEHSIAVGSPFTGSDRAIYFDGSGDKIETGTTTDFNFGTGDFTVECWINPSQSGSQYEGLIASDNYGGSGARWTVYQNYSNIQFWGYNSSGSYVSTTASSVLTVGQWHHIAVTRESGTLKIYVNGVEEQSSTSYSSYDFSDDTGLRLGNSYGSFSYQGYMYDVRVVNGTAITPPSGGPTSKLTSVTNTKLLLQPDKDDSSWGDESDNQTLTGSGDLSTVSPTASTPYDDAAKSTAISFDGTGDYLSVATSSDFDFGSGSYTYEGWFYFNGFSETPDGIFSRNNSSTQEWAVCTNSSGTLQFFESINNSYNTSSFTFSTGQWYHIALCKNGTTYKVYVDGSEKISVTLSSAPDANLPVLIGRFYDNYNGYYLDGYCFDFRAQKGVDTGGSVPSAPFELNPVYIGGDQSGNKNHFTPTNISSHDVMRDTPTSNFCTFSPISGPPRGTSTTISEGNLKVVGGYSGSYFMRVMGTVAVSSGKWFYEVRCGSNHTNSREYGFKGVNTHWPTGAYGLGGGSTSWATESEFAFSAYHGGVKFSNSSSPATSGTSWGSDGDVIGLALDLDSTSATRIGTLRVFKNGSEVGSATDIPTGGSTGWVPCIDETSYGPQTSVTNFGQDPTFGGLESGTTYTSDNTTGVVGEFHNPIPSGYLPFAAGNLPDPTVTPSEHFGVLTYTGNSDTYNDSGSTQNVTGVNFDVGMAWIKDRDNSAESSYTGSGNDEYGNYLFDTVTGTSTGGYNIDLDVIYSSGGPYLNSSYYGVTSFSAGSGANRGITVDEAGETNFDYDDGSYQLNERYVAWLWKLGSTGSSSTWNSSYTAPSTEHYNASAGVTTIEVSPASSGNLEVAHSLSAAPEFFWVADDQGYANFSGYPAFHKDLDSGKYLQLDSNSGQSSDSTYFPSGAAHADYIKLGSAFTDDYGYGFNLRIWAFTGVEGYSKFGSFVGNGSSDGTMVYTGFRPALVMVKSMGTQRWAMIDSVRGPINPNRNTVYAEDSTTEYSGTLHDRDFLSNGFKLRNTDGIFNTNDQKYLYCAWAEQPFSAPSNAR